MSSFGNSPTGAVGPAGYSDGPQRAHFLGRLENALSRLDRAASRQVEIASSLTGGWSSEAKSSGEKAPSGAGVFGAVDDIATAIHRICDRMEEANLAVSERLP